MSARSRTYRSSGFSLIELMVALTLGLLILTAVTSVFVATRNTQQELEKSSRQIENGRYAMQLISNDLRLAGFYGEIAVSPAAPTSLPAPCDAGATNLAAAMGLHVQGYNGSSGNLSCISDYKTGTDVLVVRRASSCTSANPKEANCDDIISGAPYLQVSGCLTDTAPSGQTTAPYYLLDTTTSNLTLKKVGCTSTAALRRYLTHIYFIANNNNSGDGIPTLKRWELGSGIVPLVEGVENLQVQYGIDADISGEPGNGTPDSYSSAPALAEWANVMSVKVDILSRNTESTPGFTDTKTYTLGDVVIPAQGDAYKRHAYGTTVHLANPSGRRL